jgi:hypothetical protein
LSMSSAAQENRDEVRHNVVRASLVSPALLTAIQALQGRPDTPHFRFKMSNNDRDAQPHSRDRAYPGCGNVALERKRAQGTPGA